MKRRDTQHLGHTRTALAPLADTVPFGAGDSASQRVAAQELGARWALATLKLIDQDLDKVLHEKRVAPSQSRKSGKLKSKTARRPATAANRSR